MFSFFIPSSKVQKDRRIMHETDARMAKYSRRGLVFNFIAYLICLMGGQFYAENRELTIVLTAGLAFITLLRGILLFRFYQIYPRAPQRWRNSYFVATLLGAMWWGFILVSITMRLDMSHEAPLLWLYTVVFFSTTAHAFAPYQRFLAYYQFFGLVPAAVAALVVGGVTATLYGVLMIMFYVILIHQCRLMSENYWERLEASYALARKTQSIEEEKRDTRASAALYREFLGCLRSDLQTIVGETQLALNSAGESSAEQSAQALQWQRDFFRVFNNVNDFYSVLNKELQLESKIFNIRHELQNIVAEYLDSAELDGVAIETSLSPTLPMRLKGDASRLAQVIKTLLSHCIANMDRGVVLFEVEFLREYESAGELYINISSFSNQQQKRRFFGEDAGSLPQANLSFTVARGIAELMSGSIEINEIPSEGVTYRLDAKFDVADQAGQLDFHANSFQNHTIMLVHRSIRIQDIKRRELNALGFTVVSEPNYKKAQSQLAASYKEGKPIEAVLYFVEEGDDEAREFNNALAEHPELRYTHQLIAASPRQQRNLMSEGFVQTEFVHMVSKPVGLFELENAFNTVYDVKDDDHQVIPGVEVEEAAQAKTTELAILVLSDREKLIARIDMALSDGMVVHRCANSEKLATQIKKLKLDVVLIDCDGETQLVHGVDTIRAEEAANEEESLLPILGVSDASVEHPSGVYELGIDDYIILNCDDRKLKRTVEHWAHLKQFLE
ncbi:sensor histidine kinase [Teredinibacter turnerae]|uniref:sensor histidine kinase n=1 Tax=Teredinibacter turnerae TaxID=2426 RepID=UPI0030D58DA6